MISKVAEFRSANGTEREGKEKQDHGPFSKARANIDGLPCFGGKAEGRSEVTNLKRHREATVAQCSNEGEAEQIFEKARILGSALDCILGFELSVNFRCSACCREVAPSGGKFRISQKANWKVPRTV